MKKALFFPVILVILICSANAFALTPLTFHDDDTHIKGTSWKQTFSFDPALSTGNHKLTITSAVLNLVFDIKPEKLGKKNFGETFTLNIDGKNAGSYEYSSKTGQKQNNVAWAITLTPDILKELADGSIKVKLVSSLGTVTDVKSSSINGTYTVAPEPLSMALVGAGLIGLPFARRFRKSLG
jgi:hypothetical protein